MHLCYFLFISRIHLTDLSHKAAVNLLDDLVYTRKQPGEQIDWPFFQSLCHDGVVRVSTGLCCDLPCLIPAKSFLIKKKSHKLGNCYRRMCIIHLNRHLLRQFMDIIMVLFIFFKRSLKTGRYEEILLFQSQFLSCIVVIVRVQDLYDRFCQILLLYRFVIVTTVK